MTIHENVALPQEILGVLRQQREAKASIMAGVSQTILIGGDCCGIDWRSWLR